MQDEKSFFTRIISILIALLCIVPCIAIADNDLTVESDEGTNRETTKIKDGWALTGAMCGITYQVRADGKVIGEISIDNGKSVGPLKGMGCTGLDVDVEKGGQRWSGLEITEEQFFDCVDAIGASSTWMNYCEKNNNKNVIVDIIAIPYIRIVLKEDYKSVPGTETTIDLYKFKQDFKDIYKNDESYHSLSSVANAESVMYDAQADRYLEMLETVGGSGDWGGLQLEIACSNDENLPPTDDSPEDIKADPAPEEYPAYTITPGDAPDNGVKPTAHGKIYDTSGSYDVPGGNPIPTSEQLTAYADTNLCGAVRYLGRYTINYKPATYTVEVQYTTYGIQTYTAPDTIGKDGKVIKGKTSWRVSASSSSASAQTNVLEGSDHFVSIKDASGRTVESGFTTALNVTNKTLGGTASISVKGTVTLEYQAVTGPRATSHNKIVPVKFGGFASAGSAGEGQPPEGLGQAIFEYNKNVSNAAAEQAKSEAASATVFDFWNLNNDTVKVNGKSITENGAIVGCNLAGTSENRAIPESITNKSVNDSYPSTGDHTITWPTGTTNDYSISPINPVKVHTPIYDNLTIDPDSKNQLSKDAYEAKKPEYIVTLGEPFKARVDVIGGSYYYSKRGLNTKTDYVKDVVIECDVCGMTCKWSTHDLIKEGNSFIHNCIVPLSKVDNTEYEIRSYVYAENYGYGGADQTADASINTPDNIYVLKRSKKVYVVGKIYDLQVRATDDPSWKLKQADKLSALPTGEKGDNIITTYAKGIKLGYRAYFDLKTLGIASKAIKLTVKPNIYYVSMDDIVDSNVELYYKTSATEFKKLYANDINISMMMNSTRGNAFNSDFEQEKLFMVSYDNSINYTKKLLLGGAHGLVLGKDNSTITKYIGAYTTPRENSRRWYGEFYLPASTIVAEKGATITEIARGQKVKKTGFLVVTFTDMVSTFEDGSTYLQYSMARNAVGRELGVKNSQLMKEKNGKTTITLPNGKTFSAYAVTDAPIIIYDVALRANNDYEQTGTH